MTRLDAIRQRVERAPEHLSGIVSEYSIAVMVGEDSGAFVVPIGLADYAVLAIHANRDIPALLAVVEAALKLHEVVPYSNRYIAGVQELGKALAPLLQEVEG